MGMRESPVVRAPRALSWQNCDHERAAPRKAAQPPEPCPRPLSRASATRRVEAFPNIQRSRAENGGCAARGPLGKAFPMFDSRPLWMIGAVMSACVAGCGSNSETPAGADAPPFSGVLPVSSAGAPNTASSASDPNTAPTGLSDSPAATPTPTPVEEGNPDLPINQPEAPGAGGDGSGDAAEPIATGGSDTGAAGTGEQPGPDTPPGVDPNFFIFLTFGQSNMEGFPAPEAQDLIQNPRVRVLAYDNCPGLGRVYNQWYTAAPPLHSCRNALGPGDYFGKTLADALPPEVTIGIVGNAISGVDIDFFRKNVRSTRRDQFRIPPDNQKTTAYDMIIERARLAQQVGVIKGIIFHQGESDAGQPNRSQWLGKVQEIVRDLRTDLEIGDVPFLAGELLYANQNGGAGDAMNPLVNMLPGLVPEAHVVSANGLAEDPNDAQFNLHFSVVAQRELGRRYGQVMLGALDL